MVKTIKIIRELPTKLREIKEEPESLEEEIEKEEEQEFADFISGESGIEGSPLIEGTEVTEQVSNLDNIQVQSSEDNGEENISYESEARARTLEESRTYTGGEMADFHLLSNNEPITNVTRRRDFESQSHVMDEQSRPGETHIQKDNYKIAEKKDSKRYAWER